MAKRRALITEAEIAHIFRAAKKVGLSVHLEITPDRLVVTTAGAAIPEASNDLDERLAAFGAA